MKNLKAKLIQLCQLLKISYKKILTNPNYWLLLAGIIVLIKKIYFNSSSSQKSQILLNPLSQFLSRLQNGQIKKVLVKQHTTFFLDKNNILYKTYHSLFPKSQLFNRLIKGKVQFSTSKSTNMYIINFIIILFTTAVLTFLLRQFVTDVFKSKNNRIKKVQYKFDNIIGLDQCKISLKEVIQYMKDPQKFNQLGARMRKGIVFYGPSGTGKTSLARACAGQANVPFFSTNAAQFRQMYVGMGAKKIRELFKQARKQAPSIIYIDQIDAMGNRNSGGYQGFDGAASQKNSTINQLLSELDGFDSSQMVLVIGSTNKLDFLDPALLRPGRFDLKIKVNLPTQKDRFQILSYYLKNKKHNVSQNYLKEVVTKMRGWSGAHLENLANQSVFIALRRNSQIIEKEDMEKAFIALDNN